MQELDADEAKKEQDEQAENEIIENDPMIEKYAQNVEAVMHSVQQQMEQIDDAESFLKSAFGDVDPSEWEDDEDEQQQTDKNDTK